MFDFNINVWHCIHSCHGCNTRVLPNTAQVVPACCRQNLLELVLTVEACEVPPVEQRAVGEQVGTVGRVLDGVGEQVHLQQRLDEVAQHLGSHRDLPVKMLNFPPLLCFVFRNLMKCLSKENHSWWRSEIKPRKLCRWIQCLTAWRGGGWAVLLWHPLPHPPQLWIAASSSFLLFQHEITSRAVCCHNNQRLSSVEESSDVMMSFSVCSPLCNPSLWLLLGPSLSPSLTPLFSLSLCEDSQGDWVSREQLLLAINV